MMPRTDPQRAADTDGEGFAREYELGHDTDMGLLIYGAGIEYEIDDRALSHLVRVVAAKLRRHEGFLLSWTVDPSAGSGRTSLWIAPSIPLAFQFRGGRDPELNPVWLEVMSDMANSVQGLRLTSEREAEQIARAKHEQQESRP